MENEKIENFYNTLNDNKNKNENKKENDNNNNNNNNNENNDDISDDDDDIENLGKNNNKKNNTNSEINTQNLNKVETNINNNIKNEKEVLENINQIESLVNTEEYDENFENLNSQQDNYIRNGAIITSILCIITMLLSIFIRDEDQFLTFKKNKGVNTIFINIYIIALYIVLLIICNCMFIFFITYENEFKNLRRILYKYLRWFFVLTQGFFSTLFFTGLLLRKNDWSLLLNITLSMTIIILLAFYYDEIKIRKDMSKDTLISIFIYISLLFAFICFISIFNLSIILTNSINKEIYKDHLSFIRISTYSFQTLISIINLTYFKDLFFVIGSCIIELGILIDKNKDESSEIVTLIICILSLLLSSALTIYRYKYEVIGKEVKKTENNII